MHHGYADGLAALLVIPPVGLASSLLLFLSVVASSRHSVCGARGVALFLLIMVLLMSMALAIDNFLWDVWGSHNDLINILVCCVVSYAAPLALLRRLYLKENKKHINRALMIFAILLVAALVVWFMAETFL